MDVMSRAEEIFKQEQRTVSDCFALRCEALMHSAVERAKLEERNAAQSRTISRLSERLQKYEPVV
jgi:hypothetical protein